MDTPFRSRLLCGEVLIGTVVSLSAPEITEILSQAGFDWLFIDLEHSPLDPHAAQALIQAAGGRVASILRVPLNDEIWLKKALDTGADGVMVPQVNTAEDARRAVRLCKYPPQGTRSAGVGRAHAYGLHMQEYFENANVQTAVIIQVKHIDAVRNIGEILDVDGVDAVLIGPYDLSASMGLIGQVEHPEVQAAIRQVRQRCQACSKPLGVFVGSAQRAREYIREGFSLIAASTDTLMLVQAAGEMVKALRK